MTDVLLAIGWALFLLLIGYAIVNGGSLLVAILAAIFAVGLTVRYAEFGLIVLLGLLPFQYVIRQTPNVPDFVLTYWKEGLLLLLAMHALYGMINPHQISVPRSTLWTPLVAFLLYLIARTLITDNVSLSVQGMLIYAVYMLLIVILISVRQSIHLRRLMTCLIFAAVIVSVVGILEFLFGFAIVERSLLTDISDGLGVRRIYSVVGSTVVLGSYLAVWVPYAIAISIGESSGTWRWFGAGATVALLPTLLLTYTRGAWLQAAVASIVCMFLIYRRSSGTKFPLPIVTAFGVLLAFGSQFVVDTGFLLYRFTSVFDVSELSNATRLQIYSSAFDNLLERGGGGALLFGQGVGSASRLVESLSSADIASFYIGDIESSILKILYELGLVGLLLFAALYVNAIRVGWRLSRHTEVQTERIIAAAATASLVGLAIELLVARVIDAWLISSLLWFQIGLLMVLEHRFRKQRGTARQRSEVRIGAA